MLSGGTQRRQTLPCYRGVENGNIIFIFPSRKSNPQTIASRRYLIVFISSIQFLQQLLIESLEKDKQHLQEQLAGVRAEKDALEAVLFDTATMLEDADSRRAKLDAELQDAMVQLEGYKGVWIFVI